MVRVFQELRRRNVDRVAAAYLAVAWLIVQVVETLFPADSAYKGPLCQERNRRRELKPG